MTLAWEQVIIAAADVSALGNWWATALLFVPVPEAKAGKNRLHLDFRPVGDDPDQETEVARFERLGARRVDVGQGDGSWVVMTDPEGNEFCVLAAAQPGSTGASG